MADDPVKALADATDRYAQMLAANLAASKEKRAEIDRNAPLSAVEIGLRASDSNTGHGV